MIRNAIISGLQIMIKKTILLWFKIWSFIFKSSPCLFIVAFNIGHIFDRWKIIIIFWWSKHWWNLFRLYFLVTICTHQFYLLSSLGNWGNIDLFIHNISFASICRSRKASRYWSFIFLFDNFLKLISQFLPCNFSGQKVRKTIEYIFSLI